MFRLFIHNKPPITRSDTKYPAPAGVQNNINKMRSEIKSIKRIEIINSLKLEQVSRKLEKNCYPGFGIN
jgi:hypothetical protein